MRFLTGSPDAAGSSSLLRSTAGDLRSKVESSLSAPLSTARKKEKRRSLAGHRGAQAAILLLVIVSLSYARSWIARWLPEDPYAHHTALLLAQPEPYLEPPTQNTTVPWSFSTLLPQKTRSISPHWHGRISTRPRSSLAVHKVPAHPHSIVLPPSSPSPKDLLFGWTTTAERVALHAELWKPILNAGSPCRIVLPPRDRKHLQAVGKMLEKHGMRCEVSSSDEQSYKNRVLRGLGELHEQAVRIGAKWIIISDDDTVFIALSMLQRLLADYDAHDDILIGALSEAHVHVEIFKEIAFGGGGIVVSTAFAGKIAARMPKCIKTIPDRIASGGDGMISHCAAQVRNKTLTETIIHHPALHQMDVWGEAAGLFQSGQQIISFHHAVHGWYRIFPRYNHHPLFWHETDISSVSMLQTAAVLLGGDNLFRRYVFKDGYAMVTLGYSITTYSEPLTPYDLRRIESTWDLPKPARKGLSVRPGIPEGRPWWSTVPDFKTTYYLSRIRAINAEQVELIHSNWRAQSIRIIWDRSQA